MKLLNSYRKLFILFLFTGIAAVKAEQPILFQSADPAFKTNLTSTGLLSNQFSAFIVGAKPLAIGSISFAAINNGNSKKLSVSVYKGSINGTNAVLQNRIAVTSTDVTATNESFKKFTAVFNSSVLLDVYTVYYIVLHNENVIDGEVTIGLAASIGNVKSEVVTPLSGVFSQDVQVSGNSSLVHKQAYLSVDINSPVAKESVFSVQKFTAVSQRGKNILQWKFENTAFLNNYSLEKSTNEVNYSEVLRTAGVENEQPLINYIDNNLASGKTYYRLKLVDKKGNTSFSKVVMVENRTAVFTVHIMQTQLRRGELINLQVNASANLQALFTIVNRYGQPVKQLNQQVACGSSSVRLSSADFAPGYYYLKCLTNAGDTNEDIKLVVL